MITFYLYLTRCENIRVFDFNMNSKDSQIALDLTWILFATISKFKKLQMLLLDLQLRFESKELIT